MRRGEAKTETDAGAGPVTGEGAGAETEEIETGETGVETGTVIEETEAETDRGTEDIAVDQDNPDHLEASLFNGYTGSFLTDCCPTLSYIFSSVFFSTFDKAASPCLIV